MSFEKEREELDVLREENKRLSKSVCAILEKLATGQKKDDKQIEETITFFKDYDALSFCYIAETGTKYYAKKLQREKRLNLFLKEMENSLKRAVSLPKKERLEKIQKTKNAIEQWREGKEKIDMTNTQIKEQLVKILEKTLKDVKMYNDALEYLPTETAGEEKRKQTLIDSAKNTAQALSEAMEEIQASSIEDGDKAKKIANEMIDRIKAVRDVLPTAMPSKMRQALQALNMSVSGWQEIGKQKSLFKKGVELDRIVSLTPENLAKEAGNADELTSAIFVIEKVTANAEFSSDQVLRAMEDFDRIDAENSLKNDVIYQRWEKKKDDLVEKLKTTPKTSPLYISLVNDTMKITQELNAYTLKKNKKNAERVKRDEALTQDLYQMCQEFTDVARMYDFTSRLSFKNRVQLMAEVGIYDFSALFEEYVNALYRGDNETVKKVRLTITSLKKAGEREVPEFYTEDDEEEVPVLVEEPAELTEEQKRFLLSLGIDTPEKPTEVVQEPQNGEIVSVNTDEIREDNREKAKKMIENIE